MRNDHNPRGLSTRKRPRSVQPSTALSLRNRQEQQHHTETFSSSFTGAALLQHPQWKLLPGTLTEIAGPAGVGKTQMALTLCADSVMLQQKAVYLSLGGAGSGNLGILAHRLKRMLSARSMNHAGGGGAAFSPAEIRRYLNNIFFHWVRNTEEFMDLLQRGLPKLLTMHSSDIRVVVLDEIASLFRYAEHDGILDRTYWQERSLSFFKLSTLCKQLSEQHQIPFVILNQATTRIQHGGSNCNTTGGRLEPALGLSWRQCVNASFFVDNTSIMIKSNSSTSALTRKRRLVCLKSPRISSLAVMEFYIDDRGTVRLTAQDFSPLDTENSSKGITPWT
jgi:RecA/RadA recombinase